MDRRKGDLWGKRHAANEGNWRGRGKKVVSRSKTGRGPLAGKRGVTVGQDAGGRCVLRDEQDSQWGRRGGKRKRLKCNPANRCHLGTKKGRKEKEG